MKIKTVLGLAVILTLACVLAVKYDIARSRPSDFRDAVKSEGAADELKKAVPGGKDLNLEVPAVEPQDAQTPESGGAADQGAQRIFSENDSWHRRLAEAVGVRYPCYVESKHIGKRFQNTTKLTFDDGSRRESAVVKNVGSLWSRFTWKLYMELTSIGDKNIIKDRFKNALVMTEKFRNAGLRTLEIIATDPKKQIIATKFVKGVTVVPIFEAALQGDAGAMELVRKLGSALAVAHRSDLYVGDMHTGNAMFIEGEPHFVDLDRAVVGGHKGWDIALLFYYAILQDKIAAEPEAWALMARTFLQGYLAGGDAANIKAALSRKYAALSAVLPLAVGYSTNSGGRKAIHAVRREMKLAAGEALTPESDEALGLVPAR